MLIAQFSTSNDQAIKNLNQVREYNTLVSKPTDNKRYLESYEMQDIKEV